VTQERDLTYITAHFMEHEIGHLGRMIRSRHWHGSKVWTVAYWRTRLEELQNAPVITEAQRAELIVLVDELDSVASRLGAAGARH
jgi:hypothetical protein